MPRHLAVRKTFPIPCRPDCPVITPRGHCKRLWRPIDSFLNSSTFRHSQDCQLYFTGILLKKSFCISALLHISCRTPVIADFHTTINVALVIHQHQHLHLGILLFCCSLKLSSTEKHCVFAAYANIRHLTTRLHTFFSVLHL